MTDKDLPMPATTNSGQINIKKILYQYLHYWYYFLIGIVLALALAALFLLLSTPKYLISSSVLVRDIDKGPDFQAGNPVFKDLDVFNQLTSIENELEAFRSLSLMQRALISLNLQTSYFVPGALNEKIIYGQHVPVKVVVSRLIKDALERDLTIAIKDENSFELLDSNSNTSYRFGQRIAKPYANFTVLKNPQATAGAWKNNREIIISFNSLQKLALDYNANLKVAQASKTADVLYLNLMDVVPERGKDIMASILRVYNEDEIEDKNRLALTTLEFIDERLSELTGQLTENERREAEFKARNNVTDVRSEASAYLEESRNYNNQLTALNTQVDVVESLEKYLSQRTELFGLVPSNLSIEDPSLTELIDRFNTLQLERERLLRTQEPTNPLVININQQLSNLRLSILENLSIIKRGLTVSRNNISGRARSFQSRINAIPNIERQLNDINRQQGVRRDLYVYLLQKREESALSLASTGSRIRVLDPPRASLKPEFPKKSIVLALAFFAGLIIPFAVLFTKFLLSNSIRHRLLVEQHTTVPIIGEIPHIKRKKGRIIFKVNKSKAAEQIRFIRAALLTKSDQLRDRVVLITSGQEKDGKSFLALNLAGSLAMAGNEVVLLDFNLRDPAILTTLGLNQDTGISEYLHSKSLTIDSILKTIPTVPGLAISGTGRLPEHPNELMMNVRMEQLIVELKEKFDYVVIDTAAVGEVADALALAPYVDVCLFVIRYSHTHRDHLNTVQEIHRERKMNKTLIVLNDARKEN